jgi:hypothetical protein
MCGRYSLLIKKGVTPRLLINGIDRIFGTSGPPCIYIPMACPEKVTAFVCGKMAPLPGRKVQVRG